MFFFLRTYNMEQLFYEISKKYSGKEFTKEDLMNQFIHNKKYIEDDTYNQFIQQQKKQMEDYIRFGPKKRTTQYL